MTAPAAGSPASTNLDLGEASGPEETECRYPSHAGYGGPEGRCIHCNWLSVDEIPAALSRQHPPKAATARCAKCGESLVVDGQTDGVICSHAPDGDRHARCCPYSGVSLHLPRTPNDEVA